MTPTRLDRSYRALLGVPTLGRILVSMQLARIAASMYTVALVLFTLAEFGSPELAGLVTFMSIFPGLVTSPVAGALLDRVGRVKLIILDYTVALATMVAIGGLSLAGSLPAWLLVVIAFVSSMTSTLSTTGLRSLFPLLVPKHLWERVNAVDSNGYLIASIIGPPLAGALVALAGGAITLLVMAVPFGLAAVALIGVPDPDTGQTAGQSLLRDAWEGLRYVWRNPTLRGLGFSISALNVGGGIGTIVIPLIVVDRLAAGETAVGLVFAASGVVGMVSSFLFGRLDTRGLEWTLIVVPSALTVPATALFFLAADTQDPFLGVAWLVAAMACIGFLNGPLDIGMFTVRQRRTDPAILGRAFAVSMAVNFAGFPIGAAIAGALAAVSLQLAVWVAIVSGVAATLFAALLVPRTDDAPA